MSVADFTSELLRSILSNSVGDLIEVLGDISESGLDLSEVVNFLNGPKKQTPLHLAAIYLLDESIRLLLLSGANPNVQDINGHSPVLDVVYCLQQCSCQNCIRRAVRCINVLGSHGANMDAANKAGETPLHLSAILGYEDAALALINQGASIKSNGKAQMMNTLLDHIPDIILPIFDKAITVDLKQKHLPEFQLTFDLSVLIPEENKMDINVNIPRREMGFLRQILSSSSNRDINVYRAILQHPIVHVFTDIKWNRLRCLYYSYLGFQINLLFWYLLFLFLVIFVECPIEPARREWQYDHYRGRSVPTTIEPYLNPSQVKCEVSIYTKVLACYILLCTFGSGCKEFIQFLTDCWSYILDVFNYVQWIGLGTMAATAIIVLDPIALFQYWLFPLASFGVGICWLQLFFQLGQMPRLALYVDMLAKVTINFCISLCMYSFILLAFAMSYCMLFPTSMEFWEFPKALLRVLTMMLGELNFDGLFSPEQWIRSPILAYFWYAIFLVVISLVLMNLLVGLAVNDIGGCRKDSELVVMKRKIRYLTYLEKSYWLSTLFTPKCIKTYLRNRVGVVGKKYNTSVQCKTKIDEVKKKYAITVYPNILYDSRFLSDTMTSIRQWVNKQNRSHSSHADTFCHREKEKFHKLTFQRFSPPSYKERDEFKVNNRAASGISTRARKGADDDSKRLLRLEAAIRRLESRFIEFSCKLDDSMNLHH